MFGNKDREFALQVSGRHPYLLQTAAATIWDLHDQEKTGVERYQEAADEVYRQTAAHFADTWNSRSPSEKKAITAIALAQIQGIVGEHTFAWHELIENISDYSGELRRLKDGGTIATKDEETWEMTQQAFLWWWADEIKRLTRDTTSFEEWLCQQEIDGVFTKAECQKMNNAAKQVSGLLGKGAATLIETFAKGLGAAALAK